VAESGRSLRVGILMAVGAALLAITIFSIGGGVGWFRSTVTLRAHFKRVNGLQSGAPVYLSGVDVGTVNTIRFPKNPRANFVVVYMSIGKNAMPRVRADSVAKIESMGLLGDKFLLLTSGTRGAPSVRPDALLKSQSPINYQSLLQAPGTGDLVANILSISSSVRELLNSINHGHGILAQLIKGPSNPKEKPFNLESLQQTMDNAARVSAQLDLTLERINRGQGLFGAMLSPKTNGNKIVNNFAVASRTLRATSARLDRTSEQLETLVARMNRAQGILPQLMEDQDYGRQVLENLRASSEDMRQILNKINDGQGTIGLLVNNPALYNKTTNLVSSSGWGVSLLKGLYSITHPFSSTSSPSYVSPTRRTAAPASLSATAPDAAGR
jgi:phospholipid/cholesterol/gamma-HCH transport system substrate-binding protein